MKKLISILGIGLIGAIAACNAGGGGHTQSGGSSGHGGSTDDGGAGSGGVSGFGGSVSNGGVGGSFMPSPACDVCTDFPKDPILDGAAPANAGELFGAPGSGDAGGPCLVEPQIDALFP